MGCFSFITNDTDESIPISGYGNSFTVYMIKPAPNGLQEVVKEPCYQGYGIFDGEDYFVTLAECNGFKGLYGDARLTGIDMYYSGREDLKYPQLVRSPMASPNGWEKPEQCPHQGMIPEDDDE